jgi:uncharacterized NAD(P)/FAD-binding protein YdhS
MMSSRPFEIAIVGGGFSGTMVAANLLRQSGSISKSIADQQKISISIFEEMPQLGRGVAYGTSESQHLLNVPIERMGAWSDEPGHFSSWLLNNPNLWTPNFPEYHPTTGSFAPRGLYGLYLGELLRETHQNSEPQVKLEHIREKAIQIAEDNSGISVLSNLRTTRHFQMVVLALGNMRPSLKILEQNSSGRPLTNDFWQKHEPHALKPDASVLILGSGLTMADVLISLNASKHFGPIYTLSRRGLIPQSHQSEKPIEFIPQSGSGLRTLVCQIRKSIHQGHPWRAVIDALRPHSQRIWQSLSLADQRRFLRHMRSYWDTHRHRLAPSVFQMIQTMRAEGGLKVIAGRVISIERVGAHTGEGEKLKIQYRDRQSLKVHGLEVDVVFNCTGPESDLRKLDEPLLKNLFHRELCKIDPLGLGLLTSAAGQVINGNNLPSQRIFTLGPWRKGQLWETTAVPEIRVQAAALSKIILEQLKPELHVEPVQSKSGESFS